MGISTLPAVVREPALLVFRDGARVDVLVPVAAVEVVLFRGGAKFVRAARGSRAGYPVFVEVPPEVPTT